MTSDYKRELELILALDSELTSRQGIININTAYVSLLN